jgi:hypothetical protein
MIKCYFVDVKSISSDLPRSNFIESELEQLADLMLKTDGLLRPLILRSIGVQKYTVIEGHREYYAAVRAKEKDLKNAEMVNAFVIDANIHQSAIDQLTLLKEDRIPTPIVAIAPTIDSFPSTSIEQLFPALVSAISQQLQPIVDQLAEHKKILDALAKSIDVPPSVEQVTIDPPIVTPPIIKPVTIDPPIVTPPIIEPIVDILPIITPPIVTLSTSNNPLDLINTLTQKEISLRMERSGISKAITKLIPDIIAKRNTQPEQKFNDWEVIKKEVNGLGPAKIKEIINKLK